VTEEASRSSTALVLVGVAVLCTVPGLVLTASGLGPVAWSAALMYGLAVVGAAFLLAWAAELVQLDVSQGLALAMLALVAVLPEYAVDFVFTWKAGQDPERYAGLALANMTGGNRLLIGVGWALVVFLAAWRMKRIARREGYRGEIDTTVSLDRSHSVEIAFLLLATLYSLTLALKTTLTLFDTLVLVSLFVAYLWRVARAPAEEPHLVGPSLVIARLPQTTRRIVVAVLFVVAAGVILACAEGFADALVATGSELGINEFLLVQWLAPLASEAPELLIAGLFAWRLRTDAALGALVSSKVNQWTLLVGTLPIVFAVSSGTLHGLPIDALQREELFLTAAQSAFAVAILSNRTINVREAGALMALFFGQFVVGAVLPGGYERIIIGIVYLVLAAWVARRQWRSFVPLLRDGLATPVGELAGSGLPSDQSSGGPA